MLGQTGSSLGRKFSLITEIGRICHSFESVEIKIITHIKHPILDINVIDYVSV